jgi:hypothetical protein
MTYEILVNPRTPHAKVYAEDFDEVADYFAPLVAEGNLAALPGGVIDTFVPSAERYQPTTLTANEYRGYRMDSGSYLRADKTIIASALSRVEGRELSSDDFTLCPSVSHGLLCIMLALRRRGVLTVVAELPAYFASIEQATSLGFRTLLWPTVPEEGYAMTAESVANIRASVQGSLALLVTQPKYGMGFLRPAKELLAFRDALMPGDYLIIDEAADQSVPAVLGSVDMQGDVQILRVRGVTKGLGLNSARLATIFHSPQLRELFSWIVDYAGGTLDSASLKLAKSFMIRPSEYVDLLQAANYYVRSQKNLLQSLLAGTGIVLSPLESGYIGTAHIHLETQQETFEEVRRRFLGVCKTFRVPVVRGSSMYFPYHGKNEIIRINYFTSEANIRSSGKMLALIAGALKMPA